MNYGSNPLFYPEKIIAIGDVHGEHHKLENLLSKIIAEVDEKTHIVFCGDLINKGSNSAKVLFQVKQLKEKYPNQVFVVIGNHEWMLLDYLKRESSDWLRFLGRTLVDIKNEYGLSDTRSETIRKCLIESNLISVLSDGLPYYETPDTIITHAPFDYMVCVMQGLKEKPEGFLDRVSFDLRWAFENEDEKRIDPLVHKMRICGHQYKHHSNPRIFKQRAFIDTGCGSVVNRPLTAIIVPGKKIVQSDNILLERLAKEYKFENVYTYGSFVYNTNNEKSDQDFIVVGDKETQSIKKDFGDIHYINKKDFIEKIKNHEMDALECLFLPNHLKVERFLMGFTLNPQIIRSTSSERASNSFVKAKKKLLDGENYIGQKSLFHSLRILDFTKQILMYGEIKNFNCRQLYEAVFKEELSLELISSFKPLYNQAKSEIKILAPKKD